MANPRNPTPKPPGEVHKKRKWIVHSHEATRPASSGAMADINITPLIDVMLVLLIIFMVVTPLAQRGLDISLPQPPPPNQPPPVNPPAVVVLGIEEGALTVNKSPVSVEELHNRLRDIFQSRSDKTIFVRAAGGVLYGRVVQAMDIARGAGVERIGIISEKMVEEAGGAPVGGQP